MTTVAPHEFGSKPTHKPLNKTDLVRLAERAVSSEADQAATEVVAITQVVRPVTEFQALCAFPDLPCEQIARGLNRVRAALTTKGFVSAVRDSVANGVLDEDKLFANVKKQRKKVLRWAQ